MRRIWHDDAWDEYLWWLEKDRAKLKRINKLIEDIKRGGSLGKPELLRGDYQGWSSRRIDDEHRLVYRVVDDDLEIIACRYHYGDK